MLNETEFIAIASRHQLKKTAVNSIRVADCDVAKVNIVWNLGTWFGDQFTFASGNTYQWIPPELFFTLSLVTAV